MSLRSALVVAVAALALPAPARAQETLTPEGPATLAAVWRGAVPAVFIAPGVIVRWSVTVGPGGQAGPVRLRNLAQGAPGRRVDLPAEPGTYTFDQTPGLPCDTSCQLGYGLALDQSVGGHAIVHTHPSEPEKGEFADPHQLYALDVFRPLLADDARGGEGAERHDGEQLLLTAKTEPDVDCDRLGDRTQDVGDLRLLDAWVKARRAGKVVIAARVRNAGATVRQLPELQTDTEPVLPEQPCRRSRDRLAVGAEKVLEATVPAPGPKQLRVGSEGPDTTPGNNRRAVRALLELGAAERRDAGLRVVATTSSAGSVRLSAVVAGLRFSRTVRFTTAGRHTVLLAPSAGADRQRLVAALARHANLTATLSATLGRTTAKLRARV